MDKICTECEELADITVWGKRMQRQRNDLVEICKEVLELFEKYQIRVSVFPGPSTSQKLATIIKEVEEEAIARAVVRENEVER